MICKDTLAQRAAAELNVEDKLWSAKDKAPSLKTTMRLLTEKDTLQARVDELEAQSTRRSEPMPEPVPEWLKAKAMEEIRQDEPSAQSWCYGENCIRTFARLIWERGDREPVDTLLIEAREIVINDGTDRTEHQKAVIRTHSGENGKVALALAALKRGMELAKEIG